MTPKNISPAGTLLGEGVVWIAEEAAVYWVDIKGKAVHRHQTDSGQQTTWSVPEEIGCLIPCRAGGFVAGLQSGLAFIDLSLSDQNVGRISPMGGPETAVPGNRINDGKADVTGRLWVGTMDNEESRPSGSLYRFEADGSEYCMDTNYVITNGPAFSPDGKTLYHTDTLEKTIYAFDLAADGSISNKRIHIVLPDQQGWPDGMTVDAEGYLWVAHFGGWRVSRFGPDGTLERSISLPVGQITNVAFGGPNLETLYITTAAKQLDEVALAGQPLAGALFEVETGIRGLPPGRYAGTPSII